MQMPPEPFAGEASDFLQRPGLLEEMRRSRYDPKLLLAPQKRESFLVQFNDRFVQTADDEQGWRLDPGQRVCGQVRPASARNNGADFVAELGSRDQRRTASGARTEVADLQLARFGPAPDPAARVHEALGKEPYVEAKMTRDKVDRFFFAGQQIEKQGPQTGVTKTPRNELVTRAVAAAARAVREQHDTAAFLTNMDLAFEHCRARGNARFKRISVTGICGAIAHCETSAPGSCAHYLCSPCRSSNHPHCRGHRL